MTSYLHYILTTIWQERERTYTNHRHHTFTIHSEHDDVIRAAAMSGRRRAHAAYVRVTLSELGRAPAGNWLSHKLLSRHEKGEADENDDGVLATQSVHVIIVRAKANFLDTQQRLEESIHDG